ncbi:MAG: hypothetical protein KF845_02870 [Cyclobacteriaceae bacterium]|nr:hypothetical protein [Cyclobacteriaceae bacterium]
MKWLVPYCLLFAVSCSEISYKEPQPKGVKSLAEMPGKLHGRYLVSDEEGSTDTLIIFNKGYRIGNDEAAALSDSLVLKYYKGFYFINIRDDVAWYLRIVKQEKNGDILYMAMPEATSEYKGGVFKDVLSRDIPVAETEVDGKVHYLIDPSPKKLVDLIRKGYFSEQVFKKIN